jgi:WD40 repeat protein
LTRSVNSNRPHRRTNKLRLLIAAGLVLSSRLLGLALPVTLPPSSVEIYELPVHGVLASALAPDGVRVATVTSKRTSDARQMSDYLQIWDVRARKAVIELDVKVWSAPPNDKSLAAEATFPRSLAYTPEGRELVYCDGTTAHVLDTSDYHELSSFSLTPRTVSGSLWEIRVMRLSPDGKRIAVTALKWSDQGIMSGLSLGVYSLLTGRVENTRNFEAALDDVDTGLAWSPDGSELGVVLAPNDGHFDGQQISRENFSDVRVIRGEKEISIRTGYSASDVAFVGNHELATVPAGPALDRAGQNTIRIWNTETGQLMREIPSPPSGAHYVIRVSGKSNAVLAYVGRDRRKENFPETVEQRFRLWDVQSLQPLDTSPLIPIPPHLSYTGDLIRFRISSDGKLILVWWDGAERAPVYLFERS